MQFLARIKTKLVWFDRIIIAGLMFLVVFSPLAIGSVNAWAYCSVETISFVLGVVWMLRLAVEGELRLFHNPAMLLTPAVLFMLLIGLQLLPLPPSLERALSPSTYRLYQTALPGWPERSPVTELSQSARGQHPKLKSAFRLDPDAGRANQPDVHTPFPTRERRGDFSWRPLSIAPVLTREAALKLITYGCLFFLVLLYPLRNYPRPMGERRFCRRVLTAVVITGLAIASIGLLEMAFWNGEILWFYVPYDWGRPMPNLDARAAGPFVNPDHFAAFINMILPLALAGGLLYTFLTRFRQEWFRLFCFAAAAVLTSAIALSLSRGGMLAALIGAALVIWLALKERWRGYGTAADKWQKIAGSLYVLMLICVVAGAALYTSPTAPAAVNARLEATINEPDLGSRLRYWRDSIPLIRDFPTFGVGLGCFEDLFPRYQSPPWRPSSVREAHNDYLELAADAGLAGVGLALWFFAAVGFRIYRNLRTAPPEVTSVVAALIAGLAAVAFQEFFDFALQIPANAVLFTILLAIALRLSGAGYGARSEKHYAGSKVRVFAALGALAAIILIVATLGQDQTPYPYLRELPHDRETARALIFEHPARSTTHLWYALIDRDSPKSQMRELAIAAWLEPNNPLILDRYAQALAAGGQTGGALAVIEHSVFAYPAMADHFYLQPELVPWLSKEERQAIEAGFRMAMAHKFAGAGLSFAAYCAALDHHAAEADVLARASASAEEPSRRLQLLIAAGSAYAQTGEVARARNAFEQAARMVPSDPAPYEYLASEVFAPRHDIASAKAALEAGLKNGADPVALYLALARVDEQAGDLSGAEQALLKAVWLKPNARYDYDTIMRLADLERRAGHLPQAELWMRRAIEARPGSPDALVQLASVEEADYEYGQALLDLSRALKLDPGNSALKLHYHELERMISRQSKHNSE
jgi:O-antigen ligase/Tfp pilus assembly protein PilF